MGSSKKQVLGYKYFMGLHMGICRGPVDALMKIKVGDRLAWPLGSQTVTGGVSMVAAPDPTSDFGNVIYTQVTTPTVYTSTAADAEVTASGQITINAPDLFGGEKKEGGVVGPLQILMGEPTQPVYAPLSALLGGSLVSGFRGVLTLFYDGLIATMNPYPKPWKFRVRRVLQGWDGPVFLPEKALISLSVTRPMVAGGADVLHQIGAMNPAHIIYEAITNRDWGRGLSSVYLNETSFTAAANTLHTEGLGLCVKWTREDTVEAFLQRIIDHIGAVLYLDRQTGLMNLKLIRSDYITTTLPTYTTSTGVLSIDADESTSNHSLINEVIVRYIDPIEGEERQVRVQNIAGMQASGATLSNSVDYPGLPTAALAMRIAQRDLRVSGVPLRRFTFTFDRRGYVLQPGDVFNFVDEARGIAQITLRVGRVEDKENSQIAITAVEDLFSLPTSSFVSPSEPPAPNSQTPVPVTLAALVEASYMDALVGAGSAQANAIVGGEAFLLFLGARPTPLSTNYDMLSGQSGSGYTNRGPGSWAPAGVTSAVLGEATTTISFVNYTLPANVAIGTSAIIGDEVVRVDSYNFSTLSMVVSRGCADTIPKTHAAGTPIWFPSLGLGYDPTTYSQSETLHGKFLTRTAQTALFEGDAPVHTATMVGRIQRPYPPALVRIDGELLATASAGSAGFTLEWASRNRITQGEVLVPHLAPSVTPEVGQTATVIISWGTFPLRTIVGITTGSYTYSAANWAEDGYPTSLGITLFSQRGADRSWKEYSKIYPLTAPDTLAHRYWRLLITATNGGALPAVATLAFSDGAVTLSGAGVKSASTLHYNAHLAFDANPATYWAANTMSAPQWLSYTYDVAVVVNAVAITIPASLPINRAPKDFKVQYSGNGINWVTVISVTNVTSWTVGETKTFVR